MKKLTSLMLAGLFCFVGLNLTGCGGSSENTVVESGGANTGTGDEVLESQDMMDQYAAEMAAASNPAAQQAAPAEAPADAPAEAPAE